MYPRNYDRIESVPGLDEPDEIIGTGPVNSSKTPTGSGVGVWRVKSPARPNSVWRVRAKSAPNWQLAGVTNEAAFIKWLDRNCIERLDA